MEERSARIAAYFTAIAGIISIVCCLASARTGRPARPRAEDRKRMFTSLPECTAAGTWKTCKSMPQGAVFAGTVLGQNGRIYVISGNAHYDVGLTDAVHVYDPKKDMWTEAAPIPTSRTSPGAAVGADGKIYVAGGSDRERKKNVLEVYDPDKNSWTRLKPMPTPRDAPQAVAANGADGRFRIYVLGGRDRAKPGNGLSTVEAYDPVMNTWSTMAPMLIPLHAHAAILGPDGRIYVLGGTNDRAFATDAMQIYDPVKNFWIKGVSMPYGQECATITATSGPNGEVLVFAGWNTDKRPVRTAVAFSPHTGKWRSLPPVPTARAAGGTVTLEAAGCVHVYVLGGTGEDGHEAFHPRIPCETVVEEYSFRPASLGQ